MKALKSTFFSLVFCIQLANLNTSSAQCLPMIKIDGNDIISDETNTSGIKLPSWLKAGQTLAKGQNVFSLAVIEFTVNGTSLDYSQNLSVTTVQTVPAGKVWKIESIHKDPAITPTTNTYTTAGSFTFSPTCSGTYRVKVWGAGGGGDGGDGGSCASLAGGGGGGGGYAEGSFFLFAGTSYTVIVGAGGTGGTYGTSSAGATGGTSSVSVIGISATGGDGGLGWCTAPGGAGGLGSGGQTNAAGQVGSNGVGSSTGGSGGTGGGGGGVGGAGVTSSVANAGAAPGGGGGGTGYAWGNAGGAGGAGKVEISLGGTGATSSRVPCVTLYLHSNGGCTSTSPAPCPAGWTDAGCGLESSASYCRTCYRCD